MAVGADARGRPSARRVAAGLAATIAIPGLLWFDTLVALARGWRPLPYWRLVPTVVASPAVVIAALTIPVILLAAAAIAPVVALLFDRGVAFYDRRAPHLALACAGVVVAASAAELIANAGFDRWTAFHRRPPNAEFTFRAPGGLLAGVSGDAHYRTNSRGVRGPELPSGRDRYRILCVGGSATECVYLDDAKTWPHLLMTTLTRGTGAPAPGVGPRRDEKGVWVGSVGISGYTTVEHLQFLKRSTVVDEVDCAVFLVGFNDGGRVIIGATETGPPPLWRRSSIFLLGMETVRRQFQYRGLNQIDAFAEHIRLNRLRRREAPKTDRLPDLDRPRQEYAARLREIANVCRRKGVRPVFVTQPVLYSPQLSEETERRLWLGEVGGGAFVTAARLREGMDAYNATLLDVCRELGVECVDLSDMSGHPEWFFDDCHFSESGAIEAARRIADHFQRTALR